MIHAQCSGDKQEMSDKHHQAIDYSYLKNMPQSEKKKAVSACVRTPRKDLFVELKVTFDHFRELSNIKPLNF